MQRRSKNKGNKNKSKKSAIRKNKESPPKSSGKEYLKKMDFHNISSKNPKEFLQQTTENMKEMNKEIIEAPLDKSKRNALEDELKPMDVTPSVRERIQNIPRSKAISWYIDLNKKIVTDVTLFYCNIHLIDEKNLVVDHKSTLVTCIGVSMCIIKNNADNCIRTTAGHLAVKEKDLILGTFAKTCLYPGSTGPLKGLYSGQNILPAEVILNTSGQVEKMKADLIELGVSRVSIAHSALIADGKKCFRKTIIDTRPVNFSKSVTANDRAKMCANMKCTAWNEEEELYVSEETEDLENSPPDVAPSHWFVRSVKPNEVVRRNELWGWRTNLSRAIENLDETKVIEITNAHSAEEVREFCEISVLLQRMAGQGLKESCRLLLDYCSVSVERVQAPYVTDGWRHYMKYSGHGGHTLTPLMIAACEGYYEVCELLLDRNAKVNAVEKEQQKSALHLAVTMGHRDVVRLLCKRNADISHVDYAGLDAIDIADFILRNEKYQTIGCTSQQFEKIAEILRYYDTNRCSNCKNDLGLLRLCPCHKERYCDGKCQMQRWHCHKVLHKKVMEKKK